MKKLNVFLLLFMILAIPLTVLVSCGGDDDDDDDDDTTGNEFQPVLNENFSFTVDGNDVNFTTTLTGNVWVTVNETDHTFADQEVTVSLPNAGTYSFTCSSLGSGEVLTSDPFDVVIESSNLAHLDEGLWLYLSGGANNTKTWRLDIDADGKTVYFPGPMYFSGYEDDGDRREEYVYWAWDVLPEELPYEVNGVAQNSFFNWEPDYANNSWIMAANDYGTITFDATNGTVSTTVFGQTTDGTFSFNPETWKMTLTGVVLPIDTARLNKDNYLEEDLANVRIFTLTDSAMQIGIKRSYNDDGEVDQWVNVYNFVVDDYEYPVPEEFTYTEPVNTEATAGDLVGTWVYDGIGQDWIGWDAVGDQGTHNEPARLNQWANREEMITTLTSWGGAADSTYTAVDDLEFVFNNDGTCTLAGISNTYSVTDGVITFGTELTTEFSVVFITLTGTEVTILGGFSGEGSDVGIWLGQKNGEKWESMAVHLVKQ